MLKKFDMQLVIYDETENFRESGNSLFMYPYTRRKNIIENFKLQLNQETD